MALKKFEEFINEGLLTDKFPEKLEEMIRFIAKHLSFKKTEKFKSILFINDEEKEMDQVQKILRDQLGDELVEIEYKTPDGLKKQIEENKDKVLCFFDLEKAYENDESFKIIFNVAGDGKHSCIINQKFDENMIKKIGGPVLGRFAGLYRISELKELYK